VGVTRPAIRSRATNAFVWWRQRRLCSCNLKSAWIHKMLHSHGPRTALSLEQGVTIFSSLYFHSWKTSRAPTWLRSTRGKQSIMRHSHNRARSTAENDVWVTSYHIGYTPMLFSQRSYKMKLFRTNNIETVKVCQSFFGISLPSVGQTSSNRNLVFVLTYS